MDKELESFPSPGLRKADAVAGEGRPAHAMLPAHDGLAIGLDLESTDHLPAPDDPGSEPFYRENFTRAEMAWCLRQPDARRAFCGLWTAKEAAFKCGQELAGLRPSEIEIVHDEQGRPRLRLLRAAEAARTADWALSISHAGRMGMAVCVRRPATNGMAPHA